jgi:uncharacterized membrane protein YeaQ/YmgE (transglycosylase-associated protein family)
MAPMVGADMEWLIWCAVGAMAGWLAGSFMGSSDKVVRVEEMLVGVFGAFLGGEFLADVLGVKTKGTFSMAALGISIVGAVVLLVLLRLMRGIVGPMRPHGKPGGGKR